MESLTAQDHLPILTLNGRREGLHLVHLSPKPLQWHCGAWSGKALCGKEIHGPAENAFGGEVMQRQLLKQSLDRSETFGASVLYRIESIKGKDDDVSVYVPKSAFPNSDGPFPDTITIIIETAS